MTGRLPQLRVVHVRRNNLVKAAPAVLALDKLLQCVVDTRTVWQPETAARTQLVEHEQLLLTADAAVVALGGLGQKVLVFGHLLLIRERNTIQTLQRVILLVTQEVRGRVLEDRHGFDAACVRNVRANTQVNHRTAAVHGSRRAIWDLRVDNVDLVLVVLEHLQKLLLGQHRTLKRLLVLHSQINQLLKGIKVLRANSTITAITHTHLIVEAFVCGRANAQMAAIVSFSRLTENVGRRVPEHTLSLRMVKVKQLQCCVSLQRTLQVPQLTVHLGNHNALAQALGNRPGNVHRRRLPG